MEDAGSSVTVERINYRNAEVPYIAGVAFKLMGRMSRDAKDDNSKIVAYVKMYKETQDSAAFDVVVDALEGFLQHLAYKKFFFVPGCGPDDVYQEALLALATKAIPDYDEAKGPFLGFAKLCIRRHIITILKSANNHKNKALNSSVSMDATVCEDDDGPVSVSGFLSSDQEGIGDRVIRKESYRRLRDLLISQLTPLETRVLYCYLHNMSYMEIVEAMNKGVRGKLRVDCKVIDNALCRAKKKAMELEQAIKKGEQFQIPFFSMEDEEEEETED